MVFFPPESTLISVSSDLLDADTAYTAQYRKKEFHVSYVSRGSLVRKVPFAVSSPFVKRRAPAVPAAADACLTSYVGAAPETPERIRHILLTV